jgi:uncharacterized protein involved in type VI secretion and phage assembly
MSPQNYLSNELQANAYVFIERETVDYVSITLEQAFGQHHHFSVVLDYEAMKKHFLSNPLSQIDLTGKALTIEFQQGDSGDSYQFKGLITRTASEGNEGKHGRLVIEGYSPTILLERGKRWDVFDNMQLRQVVEEVADGPRNQPRHLDLVIAPVFQTPITFLMQYNESDWEFLQRLSAITGERLYYTGLELVFGMQPREFATMEVMYDREITGIRFNAQHLPNTFTRYQYLPELNDTLDQASPKNIENANEYIDELYKRSEVFTQNRPVRTPLHIPVDDRGALNEIVMQERVATAAGSVSISGETKTCHPRIGRLLKIRLPKGMSELEELGTYRVVKVTHTIDQNHRYRGAFEAVSANLKHTPTPELKVPAAGPVSAVVVSNKDPKGLGRIWVDFPFARERRNEVWLRVMTPDAGSSGEVTKNRGMVFIPEKGDQVMVGFEFGDPNRPYVMGSLFHGKNAEGGGENNHIRSIITKSGHTIEFDDAEDTLGITIKDKNGNVIHLDTKEKNIEITAPETITMSAKNVNINAEDNVSIASGININLNAGNNLLVTADKEYQLSAEKAVSSIEKGSVLNAKKIEETAEKIIIDSTKEDMDLKSVKKVNVQSSDKINMF